MNMNNQDLSAELVRELIKEKRSERRWRNIRYFIMIALIVIIGIMIANQSSGVPFVSEDDSKDYIALVRLNGTIGPGEDFSAATVLPVLHDAFADKDAKGVILDINSGGGSPVQASIIHDAILEMKKKYHKKVIVVGEDLLASGAYFVAVAGDKIYVNPNSVTGSIGVIMKEFGFTDLIKKLGVERRVYTAGANKDRLDEFLPQNKDDIDKIRNVIGEVHANFIKVVQQGRQGKLSQDPDLFTGDFWSGESAMKLGLVDGLGNLHDVMHQEYKVAAYKDYTQQQMPWKNLLGQVGSSLHLGLSDDRVKVLEKI